MILINVSGTNATVWKQDTLTCGMVGAKTVFQFAEDWDAMAKTAVFRAGNVTKDAVVVDSVAEIPHEVLLIHGIPLEIGVYGTADDGAVVIPTVWASTRPIQPGADPSGDESVEPTPTLWEQMQEQLNTMYRSSEEITAAKEEMLQAIEDGKEEINATVAAGGYYTKNESGNSFASAIKVKKSGAIVAAHDVSLVEHTVAVKVHGKNLFDTTDDLVKTSAAEYTLEDGILNISGGYANKWIRAEEGKTYTFSTISERTGETGGGIYIRMYAEDKVNYKLAKYDMVNLSPVCTFTVEKGYPYIRFTFYGSTQYNAEESAVYSNIQLEEGSEATEYEAYIDPTTVTVTAGGSEFTPASDGTVSGILSSALADGITTDNEAVTVECEYNVDTETFIRNLIASAIQEANL